MQVNLKRMIYSFVVLIISITLVFYYYVFNLNYLVTSNKAYTINEYSILYTNNQAKGFSDWVRTKRQAPCPKWIVVTSTREPTDQLKILNDAFYGWCLLVVGQAATPSNWTYKDVVYLGANDQQELLDKFEIVKNIPNTSYKRKIIGYLYAISKGAQFIFETDDDIFLHDGLYRFRYERFKGLLTHSETNTGAVYFQPKESYFSSAQHFKSFYLFSSLENVPVIQQGLLTDNLDTNSPSLALGHNHFAMLDSRNTLFHYNAFWSLMIPLESDEWELIRSFLAIRLLKAIDERIAFVASKTVSSSTKYASKNSSLIDSLLLELNNWTCEYNQFSKCFSSCVHLLSVKNFLNKSEIKYYEQWISALNTLGFKWPLMKSLSSEIKSNKMIYFKRNPTNNQLDDLVLITFALDSNQFKTVLSNWNRLFAYTIICFGGDETKIGEYLNTDIASSNIIVIPMKSGNSLKYKNCLEDAFNVGLKQQSFLIAKYNFDFWNYDFSRAKFNRVFYSLDLDRNFDYDDVYYVRRNVANSLRAIKLDRITSFELIQDYLSVQNQIPSIGKALKESLSKLNYHSNDLVGEYCDNPNARTIWIPDYHDGPRVDISSTLVHLGMRPILANPKYASSPYPDALLLSQISHSLSNFILNYVPFAHTVDLAAFRENFNFYKDLTQFEQVDAIICSFTVSLCEAYMSLNKTIILNPAHRYNIGRCSQDRWKKLNENYFALLKKQRGIVAAMSKYDQEYQAHFTGLREYRLFAYGGFYAKDIKYNPIRNEILVGPTSYLGRLEQSWVKELNEVAKPFGMRFKHVRDIYRMYTLQNLANHRAIVIFPYASMTYSLVDFYIANIPMFVPSIEIFARYKTVADRSVHYGAYCGESTVDVDAHVESVHDYSPNNDSYLPLKYWLKYSDYYQWPFVNVFVSWNDLMHKLTHLNLTEISENMRWFNRVVREADLLENWCKIVKRIEKAHIPDSYEHSLAYFNMTDFQV